MFVIEKLKEAKKRFPNIDIVVGNIATGEAAKALVEACLLYTSSSIMCLILAGKVGSNIASELGTMRVTQQIDALEIMMCIRDSLSSNS